ncbi:hypothetical protein GCM10025762_07390 [Haloechinothrix salitolerans]
MPLALPDFAAHPPVPRDFPLPTSNQRDESTSDHEAASIGERLNRIVQQTSDEAEPSPAIALGDGTIPRQVLAAYRRAADVLSRRDAACQLHWSVLAGIGRIESGHARGGALFRDGRTASPILGPRLDGSLVGTATIPDSTGGQFDGDTVWERAVGPMQFLPSTWLRYAQDGNDDGVRDPHNVYDAALGSGVYLCAGARDLSNPSQLRQALFSYNPSLDYVRAVLAWADHYAGLGPRPSAGRTVTHTLAASRDAGEAATKPKDRKPDDVPAQPPKPPTATTPADSPGPDSDAGNAESADNDSSTPDTDHDSDSTEDTEGAEESPAAPSDENKSPDGSDSPEPSEPTDPTEPAEPTKPAEPTEPSEPTEPTEPTKPAEPTEPSDPTEPTEPGDPSCEQPADTDGTADEESAETEDRAGDTKTDDAGPRDDTTDDSPRNDAGPNDGTCETPDGDGSDRSDGSSGNSDGSDVDGNNGAGGNDTDGSDRSSGNDADGDGAA